MSRAPLHARWILAALALLTILALTRAAELAWLCDDAFLIFRYATNLVEGRGLVFNAGEYVEGYTSLSWTLMIAACVALGMAPETAAHVLGLACYAALIAVLGADAWRQRTRRGGLFLPVAAGCVVVMDDFHEWATGGLETALFTALAVWTVLTALAARTKSSAALAGAAFGLLVATRPDGLIFAGVAGAALLLDPGRRRLLLAFATPLALLLAALVAGKLVYYGELLPTAFYSKSVLLPYYGQGLRYVGLFLTKNWLLVPAALAVAGARWHWRPATGDSTVPSRAVVLFSCGALYAAYVIHVGGDFMFARRLIPVAPFFLLALEDCIASVPRRAIAVGLALGMVIAAAISFELYGPKRQLISGVSDERRLYTAEVLELRRRQAGAVSRALEGTGARVIIEGGMLSFAYYSDLPYVVEMNGLTQYSLARVPIKQRGIVGHEKMPTLQWLRDHDIHLLISHRSPPFDEKQRHPRDVYFGDAAHARILTHSDEVMARLNALDWVTLGDEAARP